MSSGPGKDENDVTAALGDESTSISRGEEKDGRLGRRNAILLITASVLIVAFAALNLIRVPVAILRPGPVSNTLGLTDGKPVIEVQGVKTYPTSGHLDFTTVSMAGGPRYPVSIMEWMQAKFDSDAEVDPESMWFQKGVTAQQVQQQSNAEMTNSQQIAEVVAMRAAGLTVPETITVAALQQGTSATGHLKVGDVLVNVGGKKVTTLASIASVMTSVKPASKVAVIVSRGGKQQTVQVSTTDNGQGSAMFGIAITSSYKFPFQVKVNAGEIGGPSAGTMFTLAIYDTITPGELTGGYKIAGTGTMSEDGTVGPIGGIKQKMLGAKKTGAKFFLAPVSDCNETKGHVPRGLTIIKINTFNQALETVKQIANGKKTRFVGC